MSKETKKLEEPKLNPFAPEFVPSSPSVLPSATPTFGFKTTNKTRKAVERIVDGNKDKPSYGSKGKSLQSGYFNGRRTVKVWRPLNNGSDPPPLIPVAKISSPMCFDGITSLVIKNIPYTFSRETLINFLDHHCLEDNKLRFGLTISPSSAYDFMYLPMDFRSRHSMGYAFVNFTNSVAAGRFRQSFHGRKCFGLEKVCEIHRARIQGRESLVKHFQISKFVCDKEDYLPVQFSPPRNGSSQCTPPSLIGTLVGFLKDPPTPPRLRRSNYKFTPMRSKSVRIINK